MNIQEIQRCVALYYNIDMSELLGPRRLRRISLPRQVAMYLCSQHVGASLPKIARYFHRDHTTVVHGISKISGAIAAGDEMLEREISELSMVINDAPIGMGFDGLVFPRDLAAERHAW